MGDSSHTVTVQPSCTDWMFDMPKNENMSDSEKLAHDRGFVTGWENCEPLSEGMKFGKAEKRKELRGNTAKMTPREKLAFYRERAGLTVEVEDSSEAEVQAG